ncbi:hypothetical protein FOFC_10568, partial [Fusarium oxysporum]
LSVINTITKTSHFGTVSGFLTRSQSTIQTAIIPSGYFTLLAKDFTEIRSNLADGLPDTHRCSLVQLTMINRPGSSLLREILSLRGEA